MTQRETVVDGEFDPRVARRHQRIRQSREAQVDTEERARAEAARLLQEKLDGFNAQRRQAEVDRIAQLKAGREYEQLHQDLFVAAAKRIVGKGPIDLRAVRVVTVKK